jgi:hypothetical protein
VTTGPSRVRGEARACVRVGGARGVRTLWGATRPRGGARQIDARRTGARAPRTSTYLRALRPRSPRAPTPPSHSVHPAILRSPGMNERPAVALQVRHACTQLHIHDNSAAACSVWGTRCISDAFGRCDGPNSLGMPPATVAAEGEPAVEHRMSQRLALARSSGAALRPWPLRHMVGVLPS